MNRELDLGWGEPAIIREILLKYYDFTPSMDINRMTYTDDLGLPELREQLRKLMIKLTGIDYPYIIVTPGATPALQMIMRHYRSHSDVATTRPLYFPYYKQMIDHNKFDHKTPFSGDYNEEAFSVIDSPGNATGELFGGKATVWDAVYHNPIYHSELDIIPEHDIHVGSMSKLFGIPGIRIGWMATHDEELYKQLVYLCKHEYSSISVPSQELAFEILNFMLDYSGFDRFMLDCQKEIDKNRQLWKNFNFFDSPVPRNGMFYFTPVTKEKKEILDKCNIKYTCGTSVGGSERQIRLNLAVKTSDTEEAIRRIKNAQKI